MRGRVESDTSVDTSTGVPRGVRPSSGDHMDGWISRGSVPAACITGSCTQSPTRPNPH